jgi:hypothetical protein
MAETNNPQSGASSAADTVPSTFEELPEHGPDNTSSPQVKGNYSQDDADRQARLDELIRKNREGRAELEERLAEIERSWDSQGLPWPEDVPRSVFPSCYNPSN